MGLTVSELIPIGEKILKDAGVEEFEADAEALLGFITGFDRQHLFMNRDYGVDDARCEKYLGLAGRRAGGEPLQYITGEQYFMGCRFSVNPDVLIPRPETESLAEKAIEYLKVRPDATAVLDLCTGSGALAIALVKDCPHIRVTATDISAKALAVAKKNAQALGTADRIDFVESDLFSALKPTLSAAPGSGAPGEKFDLIVTNPPYIKTGDLPGLQREIKDHEPLTALDGGADGLGFYRRIAAGARGHMRTGACIMAEIGHDQAKGAAAIFEAAGYADTETAKDLAGRDRIIVTHL